MKKNALILASLLAMPLLAGCDNEATSSFSSTLEALQYLQTVKNYSLIGSLNVSYTSSETGSDVSNDYALEVAYTDKGYYFDYELEKYGFKQLNEGVVTYDLISTTDSSGSTSEEVYISELLAYDSGKLCTDVWSGDFFYSFADCKLTGVKANSKGQSILDNKGLVTKITTMSGWGVGYYPYLTDADMSLRNGKLHFEYTIEYGGMTITESFNVTKIGTSKTTAIDNALASGKTYYTKNDTQKAIQSAMEGNNYTCTYTTTDTKGTVTTTAVEKFNENYYYFEATSAGLKAGYTTSGYVAVDNKTDPATGTKLEGCYMAVPSQGSLAVTETQRLDTGTTDIAKFMNYPGNLSAWSNWQFTEEASPENVASGFDGGYVFLLNTIAEDAAENFGFSSEYDFKWVNLIVSYKNLGKADMAITFDIVTLYDGAYVALEYPFTDFGTTSDSTFDAWFATLQ